jgi:hypothetical protein
MSDIKSFEDILAWQKSKDLSLAIYESAITARITDLKINFKEPLYQL